MEAFLFLLLVTDQPFSGYITICDLYQEGIATVPTTWVHKAYKSSAPIPACLQYDKQGK